MFVHLHFLVPIDFRKTHKKCLDRVRQNVEAFGRQVFIELIKQRKISGPANALLRLLDQRVRVEDRRQNVQQVRIDDGKGGLDVKGRVVEGRAKLGPENVVFYLVLQLHLVRVNLGLAEQNLDLGVQLLLDAADGVRVWG